ncbi:MAG: hypothetical protein HY072_04920 [Deltaproteobacteria bacterium]|nr:hypothetical protein [Deltaproteobacteria bacterium]
MKKFFVIMFFIIGSFLFAINDQAMAGKIIITAQYACTLTGESKFFTSDHNFNLVFRDRKLGNIQKFKSVIFSDNNTGGYLYALENLYPYSVSVDTIGPSNDIKSRTMNISHGSKGDQELDFQVQTETKDTDVLFDEFQCIKEQL